MQKSKIEDRIFSIGKIFNTFIEANKASMTSNSHASGYADTAESCAVSFLQPSTQAKGFWVLLIHYFAF